MLPKLLPPTFILMSKELVNGFKEYVEKVTDIGYFVTNDETKAMTWTQESFVPFVAKATNNGIAAHQYLIRNFTVIPAPPSSLPTLDTKVPIFAQNGKQIGTCTIEFSGKSFTIEGAIQCAEVLFNSQKGGEISLRPQGLIFTNNVHTCPRKTDLDNDYSLCTCSGEEMGECGEDL